MEPPEIVARLNSREVGRRRKACTRALGAGMLPFCLALRSSESVGLRTRMLRPGARKRSNDGMRPTADTGVVSDSTRGARRVRAGGMPLPLFGTLEYLTDEGV